MRLLLLTLGFAAISSGTALADDWSTDKLRGHVLQLVTGTWQPLHRGEVISDSRVIRTLATGHVTFIRGTETVELGPDTQIQIHDEKAAKPFTTVQEYFGEVSVEADVKNVQHFAVQTPYMAAVVKGTRFVVTSGEQGATVQVNRGHVAVTDYETHNHVTVGVNQSASVKVGRTGKTELTVAGSGELPQVLTANNEPVSVISSVSSDAVTTIDPVTLLGAAALNSTNSAPRPSGDGSESAPVPTSSTGSGEPTPATGGSAGPQPSEDGSEPAKAGDQNSKPPVTSGKPPKDDKPLKDPKPPKDDKPVKDPKPPKDDKPVKDPKPPKDDKPVKGGN